MRKINYFAIAAAMVVCQSCANRNGYSTDYPTAQQEPYIDSALDNARQIISTLSLKEKLAQLESGSIYIIKDASDAQGNLNFDTLRKYYPYGMGLMNIDFGGCPPEKYTRTLNSLKEYNKTVPHPIPIIFIGEGLHGLMGVDATVFPQAIALGCSWDTTMLSKVYAATADEAKARGINMFFSPVLDLAREPRFGRIEEMYSEDPFLCGTFGSIAVREFQREGNNGRLRMAATLKHFLAHGQTEGGRNVASFPGSANDLMNNHSVPFEMCVRAGAACVMPAYTDVCDLPVTVNPWLLKDVLRRQFGFQGLVVSDQNAIDRMYDVNHLVPSLRKAAELALESGTEIDIIGRSGIFNLLEESVLNGEFDEALIDKALTRLLVLKWRLGLFEDDAPADIPAMLKINQCQKHLDIAREAAQKTMVLLKNDGTLPLDAARIKKIAVIGPNANSLDYGGYTAEPVTDGVTVYEGIKSFGDSNGIQVVYSEGCRLSDGPVGFWKNDNQQLIPEDRAQKMIAEAVNVAKTADVVVLCIGENVSYSREGWGEHHRGDRESLELLGLQNLLAEKIKATGKPVVTLIFGGRPLNIRPAANNANALAQCFYLGQQGGNAVADVLFGNCNFEGKLSVTIPNSAGSLPCYYNMKPNRFRSYVFEEDHEVYPFGYGLSYSKFEISQPVVDADTLDRSQTVRITVNVKNISEIDGAEVVQLYIRDEIASVVRPIKELKGFRKVYLKAGESQNVTFAINKENLMFYNQKLEKVFEPGNFIVYVGNSSRDADLKTTHFFMK